MLHYMTAHRPSEHGGWVWACKCTATGTGPDADATMRRYIAHLEDDCGYVHAQDPARPFPAAGPIAVLAIDPA